MFKFKKSFLFISAILICGIGFLTAFAGIARAEELLGKFGDKYSGKTFDSKINVSKPSWWTVLKCYNSALEVCQDLYPGSNKVVQTSEIAEGYTSSWHSCDNFADYKYGDGPIYLNYCYKAIATDSDNSPDYIKFPQDSITPERYPDLFIKGVGKGIYAGSSATNHAIFGLEPNPLTPKPTTDNYSTYYDYCTNSTQLNEAYVRSDGMLAAHAMLCPYGCLDGACLKTSPIVSAIDSDNSPDYIDIKVNSGGASIQPDKSAHIYWNTNVVADNCSLIYSTDNTLYTRSVEAGKLIQTPTNTNDGRVHYVTDLSNLFENEYYYKVNCSYKGTTKESDVFNVVNNWAMLGIVDIKTSDITKESFRIYWRSSMGSTGEYRYSTNYNLDNILWTSDNVIDGAAAGGIFWSMMDLKNLKPNTQYYIEVRKCYDGGRKCGVLKAINVMTLHEEKCIDSDGGQNYYEKGTVTADNFGTSFDSCFGPNSISLNELYCDGNVAKSIQYTCPNGCKDGACIKDNCYHI